jgi:surface carbohydrate biosynthesis protein
MIEMKRPPLIIPVEIAARELDAKLLLACLAAERRLPTILGCRFDLDLRADQLPRGIRFEKGVTDASYKMFRNLDDLGCTLAACDEEALVYYSDPIYWEVRLSKRSVNFVRHMMAWGPDNVRLWSAWPGSMRMPITATGNPRMDLLLPEFHDLHSKAAAEIRDAFGNFILLNSNFGSVNFYDKSRKTKLDRYIERHNATTFQSHRRSLFRSFLDIVPEIARAFPDVTLVIRPHPAEDHGAWIAASAGLPNVQVIYSGSVLPWLVAAAAVLHNGCTTAVETFLLGAPAIAYRPAVSEDWDIALPNQLSHEASNVEALIALLRNRLAGLLDDEPIRERGNHLLSNFLAPRDGPLASERILDVIEQIPLPARFGLKARARRHFRTIKMRRRRARKLAKMSAQDEALLLAMRQRTFPQLSVDDVQARADALRGVNHRVPSVVVREIYSNIFEIEAGRTG